MFRRFIVSIASCTLLLGCSQKLPLEVDKDGGFQLKEISLSEALKTGADVGYAGQFVRLSFQKTAYAEDSTIPKKEVKSIRRSRDPHLYTDL